MWHHHQASLCQILKLWGFGCYVLLVNIFKQLFLTTILVHILSTIFKKKKNRRDQEEWRWIHTLFFPSPQIRSPRANPESSAWPWSPATTWCPLRWRQTVWRTHKDSELPIDDALPPFRTTPGSSQRDCLSASRLHGCRRALKGERTSSTEDSNRSRHLHGRRYRTPVWILWI